MIFVEVEFVLGGVVAEDDAAFGDADACEISILKLLGASLWNNFSARDIAECLLVWDGGLALHAATIEGRIGEEEVEAVVFAGV